MNDREHEQKRLLLPPLGFYSRDQLNNQRLHSLYERIQKEKYQFQKQLEYIEPFDKDLRYVSSLVKLPDQDEVKETLHEYSENQIWQRKKLPQVMFYRHGPFKLSKINRLNERKINAEANDDEEIFTSVRKRSKSQFINNDRQNAQKPRKKRVFTSLNLHSVNPEENDYKKIHIGRQQRYALSQLKKGVKTNERVESIAKSLESFNPFFRKIQRIVGIYLLKIGQLVQKSTNSIVYHQDTPYTYFYIIIFGRVNITGKNGMYKICQTGQTLLQQILQCKLKRIDTYSLEKSRAVQDSWLLKIEREKYFYLEKQFVKSGFSQGISQLKRIIKKNSTIKEWLRNRYNHI